MPPKLTTEKVTIPARDGKGRIAYEVFVDSETGLDVDPQSGEMRTREDTLAMVRSVYDVGAEALGDELERYNRWINQDSRNRERERRLFGLPPTPAPSASAEKSTGTPTADSDDDEETKDAAARAAEFRRQLQEQYYRDVVEKEQQQEQQKAAATGKGPSGSDGPVGAASSTATTRAREYRQRGNGWLQQGEHRKALRVYSEGLALFPPPPMGQRCPLLLSNAAQAHLALELFDEAAALAREAVCRLNTLAGNQDARSGPHQAGSMTPSPFQETKDKKPHQTATLVSQSERSTCEVLESSSSSDEDRENRVAAPGGAPWMLNFAQPVDRVQIIGLPPSPALFDSAAGAPTTPTNPLTIFFDAPFDAASMCLLETPPRPVECDTDAFPISSAAGTEVAGTRTVELMLQPLGAGRGLTLRSHWEKAAYRWIRALEGMGKTVLALACAARIRWALLGQVLRALHESGSTTSATSILNSQKIVEAIGALGVVHTDTSHPDAAATLIFVGSGDDAGARAAAAALELLQRIAPQVATCFTTWTAEVKRLALAQLVPTLVPFSPDVRRSWGPQFALVLPSARGTRSGAWPLALPELIWSSNHPDVVSLEALICRHIDGVLDDWKLTGKCGPTPAAVFGASGIAASILRISELLLEPLTSPTESAQKQRGDAPGAKLAELFVVSGARRAEAITGQQPWIAGVLDAARATSNDQTRNSPIELIRACADEINWADWPRAVAALRFARSSVFFFVVTEAVSRLVADVLATVFGAAQTAESRKMLATVVGQELWTRLEASLPTSTAAEDTARKTLEQFVWNSDRGAHLVFALTQFASCAALTAALQAMTQGHHDPVSDGALHSSSASCMFLWADAALGPSEVESAVASSLDVAGTTSAPTPPCVVGQLASTAVLAAWVAQCRYLEASAPTPMSAPTPTGGATAASKASEVSAGSPPTRSVWGPFDSSAASHPVPVLTLHPGAASGQRWRGGIVYAHVPVAEFPLRSLAAIAAERRAAAFGAL